MTETDTTMPNLSNDGDVVTIDKFETLFWKVIHNKYIFRYIFHVMESPLNFASIDHYYVGNRIKFKNIKELQWIVEHKQWELLKDKLKSDQYLTITESMLPEFFAQCKQLEIFQLMFEKKINHLRQSNIINNCVEGNNEVAFNYFIGLLKSNPLLIDTVLPIYQSTIKWAVSNSTVDIVKTLLSIQPLLDNSIKSKIFQMAGSNTSNRIEMIKFITENQNLFIINKQ